MKNTFANMKLINGATALLGLLGVAATIHSISSNGLKTTYAAAAAGIVVLTLLLILAQRFRPTIQAFTNRASLGQSLDAELGSAQEVWMSMHSGSIKGVDGDLLKTRRRIKVILPNPTSDALVHVARISESDLSKLQNDIIQVTNGLKSAGAEVYWFDGYIGNAITIADPDSSKAWARVEAILPYTSPSKRPSMKVLARQDQDFFSTLKSSFSNLASNSAKQ